MSNGRGFITGFTNATSLDMKYLIKGARCGASIKEDFIVAN